MRDDERSSPDDVRYEERARLRMQQLGSTGSSLEQSSAEDVERRLRRQRAIGRKIAR